MGGTLTGGAADSVDRLTQFDGFRHEHRSFGVHSDPERPIAGPSSPGARSRLLRPAETPRAPRPRSRRRGRRRSPPAGPANGSRSRTTRSATWPGASTPAPSVRSRPFTQAEPEVYAANAVVRSTRLLRQERLAPAGPSSPYDVRVTAVWIAASGSGEVTGQSLPITSRAPAPWRSPNGYCQVDRSGAEERDRQLVHLLLVAGPQRLGVGGDAQLGEARHVVGVDDLEVGDVVAQVVPCPAARAAANASSASRTPRSPIACTCTWKPSADSATTTSLSSSASTNEWPALSVAWPCRSRYGAERGREVLEDAVLHDLHARRPEAAPGQRLASAYEVGDLGDPERRGPTTARRPRRRRGRRFSTASQIGRTGVVHAGVRADDRVLPGRDAEREQVGLALDAARGSSPPSGVGGSSRDTRSIAPSWRVPGRRAVGQPLDPSVGRVRGLGGDPGELEGAGVDPGAVVVTVGQERRPVGHDGVEVGRASAYRRGTPPSPSRRRCTHGPS